MAWRRIEPGYYELVGTTISVANMKGQSVRYSGLVVCPWHVRVGHRTAAEMATMIEAKREGERLAAELPPPFRPGASDDPWGEG